MVKIVIFTTENHVYANKVIKALLQNPDISVIQIVESSVLYYKKNKLQALLFYITRSGMLYVFLQIIKVLIIEFGHKIYELFPQKDIKNMFYSYKDIASNKKIPISTTSNVNQKDVLDLLKKKNADIFVSVFFNQIFKDEILNISKNGTINIHPALLPLYKGMSPTFWVLANEERSTGVTVHKVNKKIDDGEILAQAIVKISVHDTEASIYWKCVNSGIPLLIDVLTKKILRNEAQIKIPRNKESYFSIPDKIAVQRFRKKGRKFYNFRELFFES